MSEVYFTKLAGTTFLDLPDIYRFNGEISEHADYVTLLGGALLRKEPDNKFDPYAVQVLAYKKINEKENELIHVGYLKRDSVPYNKVNEHPAHETQAKIHITEYDNPNLNTSYKVMFRK